MITPLLYLKSLGCCSPPKFLDELYSMTRLRPDFGNSINKCEIKVWGGSVLSRNLEKKARRKFKFKAKIISEIIRVLAASHIYIQHFEIRQFFPTQVCP